MCCETSLMGVPCKNDTDDLNKQNNHMDTGTGGDTLGTKVLQDSNIKSNTLEEMYEGKLDAFLSCAEIIRFVISIFL